MSDSNLLKFCTTRYEATGILSNEICKKMQSVWSFTLLNNIYETQVSFPKVISKYINYNNIIIIYSGNKGPLLLWELDHIFDYIYKIFYPLS